MVINRIVKIVKFLFFKIIGVVSMECPVFLTSDKQIDSKTGFRARMVFANRENFAVHYHDYYEIFVCLCDGIDHYINGKIINHNSGDIVFIRPNDFHCYKYYNNDFTFINFAFDVETYRDMVIFLRSNWFLKNKDNDMPPIRHLANNDVEWIKKFFIKLNQIDLEDYDTKRTKFRVFLAEVFSKFFITNYYDEHDDVVHDIPFWLLKFYNESKKIENFSLPFSDFIKLSGVSREHLSRNFKKAYGISLLEFQNQLRLNYVANKLITSSMKIIDLFLEVGYEDVSWASVIFKKKYGISPSVYRKKHSIEE